MLGYHLHGSFEPLAAVDLGLEKANSCEGNLNQDRTADAGRSDTGR